MSRPSVYLETSVIGFAATRPSRDLIVAARQQITREWFALEARSYELFVSIIVMNEVSAGNAAAARERRSILTGIPWLALNAEVTHLAAKLVASHAIPKHADNDSLHVAVAAVHGVDYLLTWNCKHIANATMRYKIEEICSKLGYEAPIICTPEELSHETRG